MDQLDLALATPDLAPLFQDIVVLDDVGSDHLPLIVDLEVAARVNRVNANILWYNLRRADWRKYQQELTIALTSDMVPERIGSVHEMNDYKDSSRSNSVTSVKILGKSL